MGRVVLFYRLILRPLYREPGRALVVLFAITIGDAAVVAIHLASNAAAGSFHSSIETLAGKDDFEVTAAGGVPDSIVGKIATLPYALRMSARIEDFATVVSTGQTVPLIGMDAVAEANDDVVPLLKSASMNEFQHINDPDAIWVTRGLSKAIGERIQLQINDNVQSYVVRGLIPDSYRTRTDAVLMDIGTAQRKTGKSGRLDRILIKTPGEGNFDAWRSKLLAALPPGIELSAQGAETAGNRRMLGAFRWNLEMLSGIALLVGAFLIYNAISVSVVRRRGDIGTLRALGASRGTVVSAFLLEAAFFGTVGSLSALLLGRLLAAGAVRMLSTTVNALYVSSRPGVMSLTRGSITLALVAGVGVALVSALAPAREASMVHPIEAMARGRREFEVRIESKRAAFIGLFLAVLGAVTARGPAIGGKPLLGYLSALLFVTSATLFAPLVVQAATSVGSYRLRQLFGVEALLASRSLGGSLRRTSVLMAALATSIAMMASVLIMVGSFRQTVLTWLDSELPADLYLGPAGAVNADQHPTISPDVADRIAHVPGVESVSSLHAYEIQYEGLPVTLAGASRSVNAPRQNLTFLSGRNGNDVLRELASGDDAVISEPFANKHHLKAGDQITLPMGERRVTFRVIDVFYDYGHEAGFIVLDWGTMRRYMPPSAPTNLAVYLAQGADLERSRAAIRKAIVDRSIIMLSNGEIRKEAIRVFDQTFAITYAVEAISILVAISGISGALISIAIDRKRESV